MKHHIYCCMNENCLAYYVEVDKQCSPSTAKIWGLEPMKCESCGEVLRYTAVRDEEKV